MQGLAGLLKHSHVNLCVQGLAGLLKHSHVNICVQGLAVFLEDGKSAVSVNEALMWAKVNPFSPLGSGIRINPF